MDWFDLLRTAWDGFQLIGAAFNGLIRAFLGLFGLVALDWIVELATIIILILVVLRYGKFIGKILFVILLLLLASSLVQHLVSGV